jgi:hypothetical protein
LSSLPLLEGQQAFVDADQHHVRPFQALGGVQRGQRDHVLSSPRSARLMITLMVCATCSTLWRSLSTLLPSGAISPPQRRLIQSTKSSTLAQRAAASFSLSSLSCRCCS